MQNLNEQTFNKRKQTELQEQQQPEHRSKKIGGIKIQRRTEFHFKITSRWQKYGGFLLNCEQETIIFFKPLSKFEIKLQIARQLGNFPTFTSFIGHWKLQCMKTSADCFDFQAQTVGRIQDRTCIVSYITSAGQEGKQNLIFDYEKRKAAIVDSRQLKI